MCYRQIELTPALEEQLVRLKNCLLQLASEVGDDPVECAKKMELLGSILKEAGLVGQETDLAKLTDFQSALKEVDRLLGK